MTYPDINNFSLDAAYTICMANRDVNSHGDSVMPFRWTGEYAACKKVLDKYIERDQAKADAYHKYEKELIERNSR
jgi:hypothetical protein